MKQEFKRFERRLTTMATGFSPTDVQAAIRESRSYTEETVKEKSN